jgi:hypothetical protein
MRGMWCHGSLTRWSRRPNGRLPPDHSGLNRRRSGTPVLRPSAGPGHGRQGAAHADQALTARRSEAGPNARGVQRTRRERGAWRSTDCHAATRHPSRAAAVVPLSCLRVLWFSDWASGPRPISPPHKRPKRLRGNGFRRSLTRWLRSRAVGSPRRLLRTERGPRFERGLWDRSGALPAPSGGRPLPRVPIGDRAETPDIDVDHCPRTTGASRHWGGTNNGCPGLSSKSGNC